MLLPYTALFRSWDLEPRRGLAGAARGELAAADDAHLRAAATGDEEGGSPGLE